MVEVILEHSVPEFLKVVTGPVDEELQARVHFRDYIRGTFLVRMFDELRDHSTGTSYSYLELSMAGDFSRNALALEEGFTSEEWEDYVRARFARAYRTIIGDSSKLDYFSSWTTKVGERLAAVLRGDCEASTVLEGALLTEWKAYEEELRTLRGSRQ